MKTYSFLFMLATICTEARSATIPALNVQSTNVANDKHNALPMSRTKREPCAAFSGFSEISNRISNVGQSAKNAYNHIFSESNKAAMTDKLQRFRKGVSDAYISIADGFTKGWQAFRGAFEDNSMENRIFPSPSAQIPGKSLIPEGSVPEGELT